jgi:hypothetical protein
MRMTPEALEKAGPAPPLAPAHRLVAGKLTRKPRADLGLAV